MYKYFLLLVSFFLVGLKANYLYAVNNLPDNYYPYNNRIIDLYVGLNLGTLADVSTQNSAGNPDWQALYNPVHLLGSSGVGATIGIRPLGLVSLLSNFRFELEYQYRNSSYKVLYNSDTANSWLPKSKVPTSASIYLKKAFVGNVYYDFRFFSNIAYPYLGFGLGTGELGIRNLDFDFLPNGVGAEYNGNKSGVPITQFIIGLQYDTKIIKTSFYVEYRYERTGTIKAIPRYDGTEAKDAAGPNYGPPKDIGFKSHTLLAGLKYYLY